MASPSDAATQSGGDTPATRAIFAMSWPMAMRAVMTFSIVIIDLYLVSSLGEEAVASIGVASVVIGFVLGTVMAFGNAMQISIAQAYGTDDPLELKSAFFSGLCIALGIVGIGSTVILLFGAWFIDQMAQSPDIATGAAQYMYVFLLVMLAEAVSGALTSHFNGCGKTRQSFYSFLYSAPVNIGSSIVLIFGLYGFPEMGLVGAAWGSFFGAFIRLLYLAVMFYRIHGVFGEVQGWLHGSLSRAARKQFEFSWPIAATFVSMTFANQVCTAIYAHMNVYQFAAMTLILPWVRIAGQLSYTWTQATGIIIAQLLSKAISREALDEFLSRAWRSAFVAACIVAAAYALIIFATRWIYADLELETRTALLSFLPVLLLVPFPRVSNAICGNVLRAAGDSKTSMNIHLAANWLLTVPLTALFVLVFDLSVAWVFAISLLDEVVKFPFFHRRIWSKEWHDIKRRV